MKILYASTLDLNQEKASTIHFLALARALSAKGHQLTTISRSTYASVESAASHFPPLRKVKVLFYDWALLFLLLKRLLRGHFDVLYHRDVPLINVLARLFSVPTIVEVNGIYVDELKAAGMSNLGVSLYRLRERAVVRHANRVICVTEGIREQLIARYSVPADRCVVIPNATDTAEFTPSDKAACREAVGLAPQPYHIGFVGKFQPWIDFSTLLRAVQILRADGIPVQCTLIGNGERYQEIVALRQQLHLTECVHMPGYVPHNHITQWIGAFDVCVATFTHKRNARIGLSPLKLFEYLACGRPVVVTALPGLIEVIQESQGGLLYDLGDAEDLARNLSLLYSDTAKRETMGRRGREYVVRAHSWDHVASQVEAIVKSIRE